MLGNVFTRRGALLSFGAVVAGGLSACNTTPSAGIQPGAASGAGAIEVDTTALMNPTAGWVQRSLPGELSHVLGTGVPLHVRIDTLYLGGGGQGDPDRMRGVATLGGKTINVRAISIYTPSPTDQALPEQALQGRVQALSVAFAYRLKRKMAA
jgi:hypothetical protein